jgi:predicted nucleic acid-binding protein
MVKKLDEIPPGTAVFIDANIFHLYLRGPRGIRDKCTRFLERVEKEEVRGFTSTLVLDELAYKLLLKRIEELYHRNPLEVIAGNPAAVSEASDYVERGLEIVLGIRKLGVLAVERSHVRGLVAFMRYSLLPRDALHLSVMSAVGCRDIASVDEDFDRFPEIVRWAPF